MHKTLVKEKKSDKISLQHTPKKKNTCCFTLGLTSLLYVTGEYFMKALYVHHDHHCLSLNREGCWGTTDDFATSFLHFSLFSTALWDLPNSEPVHSLVLCSHLFLCLPCLLPPFTVPCKMVLPDLMNRRPDHTTAVCVSLRFSGDLHVVQLPAGSWYGLPPW